MSGDYQVFTADRLSRFSTILELIDAYQYPYIILACPSDDWADRAIEVIRFIGFKFTIAIPERFIDRVLLGHGQTGPGSIHRVFLSGYYPICLVRIDSVERIRVRDLKSKYLKGVLGLQYADRLINWFNGYNFREMIGVSHTPTLGGDDFIRLIEVEILDPFTEH
ncbi:MAG: hypothetical protein UT53_C0009G0016 [Candidatus Yanofskybacteria bacterium GW2011_GWD2_39_48]|uniref:Uncharacterized protein n=1 Tax=Candidatus Yanofskybacteria bacterium GW2011_GWD2_39_48 TaxID=1619031 RepID=A0A0G0SDI4_9BACT|nr:MAG: hypothetical protein UT53_C0009G0016 [Candidatus Yanofskybacteria bacterium GW2011_GWD2_39_48]